MLTNTRGQRAVTKRRAFTRLGVLLFQSHAACAVIATRGQSRLRALCARLITIASLHFAPTRRMRARPATKFERQFQTITRPRRFVRSDDDDGETNASYVRRLWLARQTMANWKRVALETRRFRTARARRTKRPPSAHSPTGCRCVFTQTRIVRKRGDRARNNSGNPPTGAACPDN